MMGSVDFASPSGEMNLSSGSIEKLPDSLLARIFAYLPFKERYQLRLVSSKWAAASRLPWTDVTFLSLSSIPRAMANPILGLCPKIKTIEAKDLTILVEKRKNLSVNLNVHTLKLRNTKFAFAGLACGDAEPSDSDSEVFLSFLGHFKRFPKLKELNLQNVSFTLASSEGGKAAKPGFRDFRFLGGVAMPDSTALSLRRLVLTDSATSTGVDTIGLSARGMQNLECLYVEGEKYALLWSTFDFPQLRELCVVGLGHGFTKFADSVAKGKFPKLEVLICPSICCVDTASLSQLITVNFALRVLVIAGGTKPANYWTARGSDSLLELQRRALDLELEYGIPFVLPMPRVQLPVTLPARKLLPVANTLNGSRMPPLQIFVGGYFTMHVRFTLPSSDVAKFWRIDCPMPEYLAKPEVAEIFKDIFVAKLIREGPEIGLAPWGYPDNMELFFSTEPLLFCC